MLKEAKLEPTELSIADKQKNNKSFITKHLTKKMKVLTKLSLFLLTGIGIVATGCKDPQSDNPQSQVTVNLVLPEGTTGELSEASCNFTNLNTTAKTSVTEFVANSAIVTLDKGAYSVEVSGKLDGYTYVGLSENISIMEDNQTVGIQMSLGKISGDLVIAEIFFTGTTTPENEQYSGDQYIRLYNNSDDTVYADGVAILESAFMTVDDYTYTPATRYQYLFGPDFLVAPVYQDTQADTLGNDIRDGIYLPEGRWVDYFTGAVYEGGRIMENFPAPLWKLPVFVRQGAVIPMVRPNNNPSQIDPSERIFECWPAEGEYHTHVYDDDGRTMSYLAGESVTTRIDASLSGSRYILTIHPAEGSFDGFVKDQSTQVRVNITAEPRKVTVKVGGKKVNAEYSYDAAPQLNRFATPGSEFEKMDLRKNPVLTVSIPACDITQNDVVLIIDGYEYAPADDSRICSGELTAPVILTDKSTVEPYAATLAWEPQELADYYEIEFDGLLHTGIRNTYLTFADLQPETDYSFRLRAVNLTGASDWTDYSCTTEGNPLEWAIRGIVGSCSFPSQEGFEVWRLFDWAESGDTWHTKYQAKALPFELTLDLQGINNIDRFEYLPRLDAGNGVLLKGEVFYSVNGKDWTPAGAFEWERDGQTKVFTFEGGPRARYIRIAVSDAVNNYGSGREIYVFKVPGTETVIPGDINKDGKVDENDLTSYMNYTGLRSSDSDFDYVSVGDLDGNGLIDAYDISAVAVRLDGGINTEYWMREYHKSAGDTLCGGLRVEVQDKPLKAGDTLTLSFYGDSLKTVNALSLALPYDASALEFAGVEASGLQQMENLTRDRLHTDGTKAVYPTFVNLGGKSLVSGDGLLFRVSFKVLRGGADIPEAVDAVVVSPALEYEYVEVKK